MQRIFHTPEGVRDIYSQECSRKQKLQEKLHRVFHQYGFEDIETPTFEYFEVFSKEVGTIPSIIFSMIASRNSIRIEPL